jgi:hypothetical protein
VFPEFWDAVTSKLVDRWGSILAPSAVFWAGGGLAWVLAGSPTSRLKKTFEWFDGLQVSEKIGVALGVLLAVTVSAIVVQRLTTPVLRLLEGYWPWLPGLTRVGLRCATRRKRADDEAWQQLQAERDKRRLENSELTAEQRARLARLDYRLRHQPVLEEELLPTRIGNILRAAETRPSHFYGLDAVLIWPRLWLVLPELARQELSTARGSLDVSVAAVIWGLGFTAFAPVTLWTVPIGLLVAASAWAGWVPSRAEVFADLVDGAYDLYRTALYQQLRWPLPATPADEIASGQELTLYLVGGSEEAHPVFTPPPDRIAPFLPRND